MASHKAFLKKMLEIKMKSIWVINKRITFQWSPRAVTSCTQVNKDSYCAGEKSDQTEKQEIEMNKIVKVIKT